MAGQGFQTPRNSMPWPGDPLSIEMIRAISESRLENSNVFRLAADFYGLHHQYHSPDIASYLPDTQGVFDIAHLLYGDEIFYSIFDSEPGSFMTELMEISLSIYLKSTKILKSTMHEDLQTMIHGHGTEQGLFS